MIIPKRGFILSPFVPTNDNFGVAQSWDDLVILDFGFWILDCLNCL
jgi:hypothetical protein